MLQCACLSFRQASRMVTQLFDDALVPVGLLSTQLPVLIVLNLHSPLTITRLASMLIMDRTTLTKNLKPLQAKGYIRTVRSDDKRKTLLELTPQGEALLVKSYPLWRTPRKRSSRGWAPTSGKLSARSSAGGADRLGEIKKRISCGPDPKPMQKASIQDSVILRLRLRRSAR